MNPFLPVEYIVFLFVAVAALSTYTELRSSRKASPKIRMSITVLRFLALATLAVIALNPSKWHLSRKKPESELAVLLDTSESMKVKDVNAKSRFIYASDIARKIAKSVDNVRIYPFSDSLSPPLSSEKDLTALKPEGTATNISKSGSGLLKEFSGNGKKLGGIVILSDGRETSGIAKKHFPIMARSRNIPLYGICAGGRVLEKNITLKPMRTHYTVFKGETQKITCSLTNKNMGAVKTVVEILNTAGKKLKTREVELMNDKSATVDFNLKIEKPGIYNLILRTPRILGEKSYSDNKTPLTLNVIDEKLKILMVEGRPFWDSKFLSQLFRRNASIDFTDVYRLTSKRFFMTEENSESHESERVIFPDSIEEIAKYNIIIFGKGAEFFMDEKRISILKHYIRDYGGAIIFARGKPYSGSWNGFKSFEPVRWAETLAGEFKLTPSKAGVKSGLFGEMLPSENDILWDELPPVEKLYRCPDLKSFSEVLMSAGSPARKRDIPVLIKRKYGNGIVIAVNGEGMWKWDFFPLHGKTADFYRKFWIQLVFWAVKYSDFLPNREYSLFISANRSMPDERIIVQINTKSKDAAVAGATLNITENDKLVKEIAPAPYSPKTLRAMFSLHNPGRYRITLNIPGKTINDIFAVLNVTAPQSEKKILSADREHLESLLNQGGGKIYSVDELMKILKNKTDQPELVNNSDRKLISTWNTWWMLVMLLGFFAAECYLRRRNGML